jgi:NACalpha-BTF3-like transcription factor
MNPLLARLRGRSSLKTPSKSVPVEEEVVLVEDYDEPPEYFSPSRSAPKKNEKYEPVREEFLEEEEPEDHAINLVGDGQAASDASTAIKALLGQGGDMRAASQLEDDQIVAIFDLLDVGEEMGSPRLLKNAEDFLILRISAKGGTGRQQIVSAFKGLYEPSQGQQGDPNNLPVGSMRGRP